MDKLIFLLNTSWQWGLIVGIVWLLVYRLRRAHAICYALWLTALVMLPILLGLNALLPGIAFHQTQTVQVVSALQSQPTDTSNHQSPVGGQVIPILTDYIALAVLSKYGNEVIFAIAAFGYFPRIWLNCCCICSNV